MKIHFCCGKNKFDGWTNHDLDMDITKPLPFGDDTTDFIYIEHGLEHIDYKDGYNFISECYRILKTGGVVRLAVPCVEELLKNVDDKYRKLKHRKRNWRKQYGDDMSERNIIRDIMFSYEHKAVYTKELLKIVMDSMGFNTKECNIGESEHDCLLNIDGLGRGRYYHVFCCKTGVIEGAK